MRGFDHQAPPRTGIVLPASAEPGVTLPPMLCSEKEPTCRPLGAVYTPKPLARFLVDRLSESAAPAIEGRWLDPACGDGVFLAELVDRLASQLPATRLASAVEERLFGIDIDPAACCRAREAVRNAVARHSGPQERAFFASNVSAGDFLTFDPQVYGGFDVVLGNPPYVSAQGLTIAQKRRLLKRFQTTWGRLDLYSVFIEHGLQMLNVGGRLAFITPDTWLTAASSKRLRQYIATGYVVRAIERFERHDLFPGVATVPCVSIIERPSQAPRKTASVICRDWHAEPGGDPTLRGSRQRLVLSRDGSPWRERSRRPGARSVRLGDLAERISVGLATGLNSCFVLDACDTHGVESELLHRAVRGRDVRAGELRDSGLWLLVPYDFSAGQKPTLVDLAQWPGASNWLAAHRDALERRHCVRTWQKRWFDLHDPVVTDLASQPKILCPDLAREPRFAFDPGGLIPLHSAYYLVPRAEAPIGPKALVAALNTEAIAAEVKRQAPTAKSGYRRLQAKVLQELPIPRLTSAQSERFEEDDLELEAEIAERVSDALRCHAA